MVDIEQLNIGIYFRYKILNGSSLILVLKDGIEIDKNTFSIIGKLLADKYPIEYDTPKLDIAVSKFVNNMLENLSRGEVRNTLRVDADNINLIKSSDFINRLRDRLDSPDVLHQMEKGIKQEENRTAGIRDFNNRIDRVLKEKYFTTSDIESIIPDLKRYKAAEIYKGKDELQRLYIKFVETMTKYKYRFVKADSFPKYTSRIRRQDGKYKYARQLINEAPDCITILSKRSKMTDFVSTFYAMEKASSMISTSADEGEILKVLDTSYDLINVMAYKLGITDIKYIAEQFLDRMSDKDKNMLVRLELALDLI